jgi:Ala-tRNA(Pro) deacylase
MNEQNTVAKTSGELFAYLDSLGIAHNTVEHEPVFTVAESQKVRERLSGGETKNLFLKDKKGNYFLVTALQDTEIDLRSIHTRIDGRGRVSFGNAERLMEYLGVVPGSVTAFGVINDAAGVVRVVLDAELMKHHTINCHPLRNDATTAIARDDLLRFLESTGHAPIIVALS